MAAPGPAARPGAPAGLARPGSLAEAVRALAAGDATVVAGGTDLWVGDAAARLAGRRLVAIARLAELAGIEERAGRVRIGAAVTVAALLESALIGEQAPLLAAAAARFASPPIRNVATLGGNLANASPAADLAVALLACGAELELARWADGALRTRRVPLDGFFLAPGRTRREPGELVTAVELEPTAAGTRAVFAKSGPRPALEIARVALACAWRVEDGVLRDVRVAAGAVAPTPLRCRASEQALEGRAPEPAVIERALAALDAEIAPIDDQRASA